MSIRTDAQEIIQQALHACLPDQAVRKALAGKEFGAGKVYLVAIGKAAWQMASCGAQLLGDRLEAGVVVTKHDHSQGEIPRCTIIEGGHPVPDEGSFRGTQAAMDLVRDLKPEDTVVFLVSGGGSALFECPLIPAEELMALTNELLGQETPKALDNVETVVTGSVRELCAAAAQASRDLGYEPVLLTDQLCCQAKEAGSFLASIAKTHQNSDRSLAFLAGGETVVQLTGHGKGGRNQELALAAAEGIAGLEDTLIFSLGSDGTDGPTDAAGGIVDGTTKEKLKEQGLQIHQVLEENDAYPALEKVDGLILTGPTGTNVNDVAVVLIRRP